MPGFPRTQPSPSPVPSLAFGNGTMSLERTLQYEVGIREQRIRELEFDNMRLMVKLEQAEEDVKAATNMIMVATRSGSTKSAKLVNIALPRRVEGLRATTDGLSGGRSAPGNSWNTARCEANSHNGADVERDLRTGRQVEEGWDVLAGTRKVWGWPESGTGSSSKMEYSKEETRTYPTATKSASHGCDIFRSAVKAPVSLLDFDDDLHISHDHANNDGVRPPLRPLTPLGNVSGVALADPFVTDRKGKREAADAASTPCRTSMMPFRHLFDFDTSDERFQPKRVESSTENTTDYHTKQGRDVSLQVTAADILPAIPEVEFPIRQVAVRTPDPLLTALYRCNVSEGVSCLTSSGTKLKPDNEGAISHGQELEQQISSDSDPVSLLYPPLGNRDSRRGRRHRPYAYDEEPARFNPNKPAPRTEHEVSYTPHETANNYLRTVMIYNLPAQVDIAEILSRVGDAPLLSIKLLPTMGMEFRKADGTTSTINTTTAMVIFFLNTSAEQFVFDASIEPLVIRGRTVVIKLLDTPTYPSCLHSGAYATAPGRLFSRRIRFHQPGSVTSDQFADVLAGRSIGYKQPGWIVDMTMKRNAGKNIITVEFASVETAAFAFGQMMWLRDFQGCNPHMVFDHETGPSKGRHGGLKTRDDGDSCHEQASGDEAKQQVVPGELGSEPSSLGSADEVKTYDGPEAASFVAPPVPSFSFRLPV